MRWGYSHGDGVGTGTISRPVRLCSLHARDACLWSIGNAGRLVRCVFKATDDASQVETSSRTPAACLVKQKTKHILGGYAGAQPVLLSSCLGLGLGKAVFAFRALFCHVCKR